MVSDVPRISRQIGPWWLLESLGSGFSGSIYRAQHLYNGQFVALKIQDVDHECPTNQREKGVYPRLQGGVGMPHLWGSGVDITQRWDYLAIDLLGPSLESLYRRSGEEMMDIGCVCTIAMQLIARLEFMHSRGILHRDIQLGNCVIGLPPNEQTIYMIDFGFSKNYIDPHTRRHILLGKKKKNFTGNYWFSSVAVHCLGRESSRRDDLEAAALMFIHLLTPGGLSWTRNGIPKTDGAHTIIKEEKKSATPEDLCRGLPSEFEEFLRYCRQLQFRELPDYAQWIDEFKQLAIKKGYSGNDAFIYPPPAPKLMARHIGYMPRRSLAPPPSEDIEKILADLTKLKLDDNRLILGDRKNIEHAVQDTRRKESYELQSYSNVSSDDTSDLARNDSVPAIMKPKAYRLKMLTMNVRNAVDNAALSEHVKEFITILNSNKSKNLTKEGFAFLDALEKQLADPSVFVTPMRRHSNGKEQEDPADPKAKLGIAARLRREVRYAKSNKALGDMVQDFGKVMKKSTGHNITKDGFAFFEGMSERLMVLE